MSRLSPLCTVLLTAFFSFLLAGGPAAGAVGPAASCILADDRASSAWEPSDGIRKVMEYGRAAIEATGPSRLSIGDGTWSSYSVDLQVQLRRGELSVELLRSLEGHYSLLVDQAELRLERVSERGVELLERVDWDTRQDRWASLRIELDPAGTGDRILVSSDGRVILGNPDASFTSGGLAVVVPTGSEVMLRGLRVEGSCPSGEEANNKGCVSQESGGSIVLEGPVLETESAVGQWQRGEVTYDTSDYFTPPVTLKFRGTFTDGSCPRASSDLRLKVAKQGVYHLMARIFSPGGKGWDEIVRAAIRNDAGETLRTLDGESAAHIFGHGPGLVSLGAWTLSPGLYTLTFQATTSHPLVIDYLLLLPQIKVGEGAWALLPQSGGMPQDGWQNGMAALTVESSAFTATPKSSMTIPLRVPVPGRYSVMVDAWYTGGAAPLTVSLTGSGGTKAWTINPDWASGEWSVRLLGPVELPAGEASLVFTHEGSSQGTVWATDSILLIPE